MSPDLLTNTDLSARLWSYFLKYADAWLRPHAAQYTGPAAHIEAIGPPVREKRRPLAPNLRTEVDRQIDSQLAGGVIEPSHSPWASPVHMVRKADGTWRMVIDYRQMNKQIRADTYPLPLISEILHDIAGHKYYITLDLNWGFWNLPLTPASRPMTAFITHRGLHQYRVLPFGMRNSPSEFQRMSDAVFGHLYDRNVRVYIDDIVIWSDELEEVLELLERVLQACVESGIYLKLAKSSVLHPETKVLGHIVSISGIRPDPKRIQGLISALPPQNKKQLMSFLGSCGYLHNFISDYSELTYPLRTLLRKRSHWTWLHEHQEAHDEILLRLAEAAMLSPL